MREVNFAEEYLREGAFVIFETGPNVKTGKLEARKIGLLTDETDKEIIEFCLNSSNRRL